MSRNLKRRIDALAPNHDADAVLEAVTLIRATGEVPPGRIGKRAANLWDAACRESTDDFARVLSYYFGAMGTGPLAMAGLAAAFRGVAR